MSVQEYLDKHMLSRKIEDAVNAAVRAKSPDPVLFIVIPYFLFSLLLLLLPLNFLKQVVFYFSYMFITV